MSENKSSTSGISNVICLILAVMTAMVGYNIHHSIGWSIWNFLVWPFMIIKWLICKEITWSIIKETFSFFMQ